MINGKTITLAIVGTTNHSLMSFAVNKTVENVNIDKIKVFSDKIIDCNSDYEFISLPNSFNLYDYSNFLLKELNNYIDTDFVCVIQYDGFATNKNAWDDNFLNYDYVGSYTSVYHPPLLKFLQDTRNQHFIKQKWYNIGGGFSLRSKKLLEALADPYIRSSVYNFAVKAMYNCEDIFIAILYKSFLEEKYNIQFAPADPCLDFSSEIVYGYTQCLGFHGWHISPYFLSEEECIYYAGELLNNSNLDVGKLQKFQTMAGLAYSLGYYRLFEMLNRLLVGGR